MAKTSRAAQCGTKRKPTDQRHQVQDLPAEIVQRRAKTPIEALNAKQAKYLSAIRNFKLIFGIGPAGTGKTYIAGSAAAEMLESKLVEKIIITRPAVDAGESLGFLPGELEDKYEPYIAAFRDVLNERLGKSYVEYLIKIGRLEAQPFAYMRGRTFKNAVVLLDEAQNATPEQMKLFLTRIGENCTVIVDGDPAQFDIRNSGLLDAIRRLSHIPAVKVIEFGNGDIVRSGLVQEIVEAYETPAP